MYEMQFCPSGLITSHLVVSELLASVPNSIRFCCTGSHVRAKIDLFVNYSALISTRTVVPCNKYFWKCSLVLRRYGCSLDHLKSHTWNLYGQYCCLIFLSALCRLHWPMFFSPRFWALDVWSEIIFNCVSKHVIRWRTSLCPKLQDYI